MKPRITLSVTEDGEFELAVNEAGRDLLVRELQRLSETSDHVHFAPDEDLGEVVVSTKPYRPTDRVLEWGKLLYRPDTWDRRYFPHVMDDPEG